MLAFGSDRMLYIGLGDGGRKINRTAPQDPKQLHGKMLRLDVLGDRFFAPPRTVGFGLDETQTLAGRRYALAWGHAGPRESILGRAQLRP